MRSCEFLHVLHDGKGLPGKSNDCAPLGCAGFREESLNYRPVRLPNGRGLLLQEIDPIGRQGAPDVFSFGVEVAPYCCGRDYRGPYSLSRDCQERCT